MKIKVQQSVTGIKGNQPFIAFAISGKEYDRVQSYHGKKLNGYVIDVFKPKRSNEANAYMWQLLDQIAEKSDIPAKEIYRQCVRDAGVKCEDFHMDYEAAERFKESWEAGHAGRYVEINKPAISDVAWVRVYYGSSDYNSKEMARLIDYVVGEAKRWYIETLTPDELKRLKGMAR